MGATQSRHVAYVFTLPVMVAFLCYAMTNVVVLVQNPANKREVLCNDVLKSLTGLDKFLAFGGQKYFSQHILK